MAHKVQADPRVLRVRLAIVVPQDPLAHQETKDQPATAVLQVSEAHKAHRVQVDLPAHRVNPVPEEIWAHRERQVPQEPQENVVSVVAQETVDHREQAVAQVHVVLLDVQDRMVPPDHQDPRVNKAQSVAQDWEDSRD